MHKAGGFCCRETGMESPLDGSGQEEGPAALQSLRKTGELGGLPAGQACWVAKALLVTDLPMLTGQRADWAPAAAWNSWEAVTSGALRKHCGERGRFRTGSFSRPFL